MELKNLRPDFISVTYGAGGSNARNAADIAGFIKAEKIEPLAHVTGGPSSPEEIDAVAKKLKELGVENVLALRGGKPVILGIYTGQMAKVGYKFYQSVAGFGLPKAFRLSILRRYREEQP